MVRILVGVSKKPAAPQPAASTNTIERVLAFMIVAIVAISLLCFVAVIAGTSLGVGAHDGFSHGVWPTVFMVPYIGLPVAFLMIIALLSSNAVRRRRTAAAANARGAETGRGR